MNQCERMVQSANKKKFYPPKKKKKKRGKTKSWLMGGEW